MKPSLGQLAYDGYRESLATRGRLFHPPFHELSMTSRAAWEAAADAVTAALIGEAKIPCAGVEG